MTDRVSEQRTILESELIFGARRSLRTAWGVAIFSSLIAVGELTALVMLLPLKETQAYLTIVDRDTASPNAPSKSRTRVSNMRMRSSRASSSITSWIARPMMRMTTSGAS